MSSFTGHNLLCVRGQRAVFRHLDFAVPRGGALLLVGPNGSGKSTLLRCMAGLLRPAEGELRWNGAAIAEDPEAHRRRLHFLGHADAVKPTLSVEENLRFWTAMRGAGPGGDGVGDGVGGGIGDRGAACGGPRAALAHFGLEALAEMPTRLLSAGQRRRLALARLLATPAPLWLLDEPATALDSAAVARLEAAIAGHRAAGGSVVLSSHGDLRPPQAATLSLDDFAPDAAAGPESDPPETIGPGAVPAEAR